MPPGRELFVAKSHIAQLIHRSYLEIIPVAGIEDRLAVLPQQAYVAITCSPTKGIEPTLQLAERLANGQFRLVPHIAARAVRDRGHLEEILQRLQAARIKSIFVPGGDAAEPLGAYDSALPLLRAMAEIGHDIEGIGVAAHPEGHPMVNAAALIRLLLEKQAYASYLVTQMCFDPVVLGRWLTQIREAGVSLPAWIGLPGVADPARLFKLSLRIGVGQSARLLLKHKGLLKRMMGLKPYQPDELLAGLTPWLDDTASDIAGFHLFSFNDIERTEQWRRNVLAHYSHVARAR